MLQLFDNQAVGCIGRPAAVSSALWSVIIHGSVFLFLLSLGLSPAIQSLPDRFIMVGLAPPPPPPPAPPPPAAKAANVPVKQARVFAATLIVPVAIPNNNPITDMILEALPEVEVTGGVPGGIPGGVLGGVLTGVPSIALPPPPPPPPPVEEAKEAVPQQAPAPERIQVSANVQEAKLLQMIRPEYPPAAKIARIQGTVRLRAIIDGDGRIAELNVIEGHPLLVGAARAAVAMWRYRPTILNGEAVEVAADIVVNFKFN